MIHYDLACDQAHGFDAWFRSSADFDRQAERGLLTCPQCGSAKVGKALMAPAVRLGGPRREEPAPAATQVPVPAPVQPGGPAAVPAALAAPETREVIEKLRELKAKLLENSENVGPRFADEARRIHYGDAPARAVHGQATVEEARELVEEGVGILPLPVLPEERN